MLTRFAFSAHRYSCDQDGCKYILTIKNIKIADSGTYKAEIEKLSSTCKFTVNACKFANFHHHYQLLDC